MKACFVAVTLFLSVAISDARIGENAAECSKRYGEAIDKSGKTLFFKKENLYIYVYLGPDGKCHQITYATHPYLTAKPLNRDPATEEIYKPKFFDRDIMVMLLSLNSADFSDWNLVDKRGDGEFVCETYKTKDGLLKAEFMHEYGVFIIETKHYRKYVDQENIEKKRQSLEGF